MPIPKAAPNDVFGYYFHHAVFVKNAESCRILLDSFAYDPVSEAVFDDENIWVNPTDAVRIYAPYLSVRMTESESGKDGTADSGKEAACCRVEVSYGSPDFPEKTVLLTSREYRVQNGRIQIELCSVMSYFGKRSFIDRNFAALEIDPEKKNIGSENGGLCFDEPPAHPSLVFRGFKERMPYLNILRGKDRGELNYCLWYEPAKRLIPYRMYIPFGYQPGTPQKTIVCFHGGDANCDYMFFHTKNEIELWAEREGYILLAVTSYRKYTFFGASRFPAGAEPFDSDKENPLGLTDEEWETSIIAEQSVMAQIKDASVRYCLDRDHLFAMGNSGGSLGIFRQVQAIGKPFFKAVACSGGVGSPGIVDYEIIKSAGTKFLLVMSSEDEFDGQFTGRVAYPIFRKRGMDVTLKVVGGGHHLTGWASALPEIFGFFRDAE